MTTLPEDYLLFIFLCFYAVFVSPWPLYHSDGDVLLVLLRQSCRHLTLLKKVNRKVQEEPQAEAAANPRYQEEEKKWHRLTCAQPTNKCTISTKTSPFFPKQDDQNANRTEKHTDKEQGKTKHEVPRSVIYTATQNKNNIGTTALERSVVGTTVGFKGLSLYKLHPGSRYNS